MKKKVTFSENNDIYNIDNYDRTNDELTSAILDKERFLRRIKDFEEKYKLVYNKNILNKMSTKIEKDENLKSIYNKKILNKMTYCELCQTSIKNFKIHEKSNKHRRNINNFIVDFNYLDESNNINKTVKTYKTVKL